MSEPKTLRDLYPDHAEVVLAVLRALRELEYDQHVWSQRPCTTCQHITDALGEPFGCVLLRVLGIKSTSDIVAPHSGPKETKEKMSKAIADAVVRAHLPVLESSEAPR